MAHIHKQAQILTSIYQTATRLAAASVLVALVACSSTKLNDVPVVDKRGTAVQPSAGASAADGSQVGQRDVTPGTIDSNQATAAGPANVAKVIYFDYDSYVIKPEFQSAVDAHAKFLIANKGRKVAIEGHTDERGGREYNLALGQKRAETVRRALVLLGATDAQIEAVSFGKEKPAAPGSDEASWAQNRRAEINYR
jgi:peptidoglycan-associated lipoprotein